MTEIEINNDLRDKYYDLPEYQPDFDDYDARCAEIFITLNRGLVFHCSFCNKKYDRFEYFLKHLSVEHYENIQEQDEYETKPEYKVRPDFDRSLNERDSAEALGPLEETLHEYDELQYSSKFKVEEELKNELSDDDTEFEYLENGQTWLEGIENVIISKKPHTKSDEAQNLDQEGHETSEKVSSPLSSENIKRTTLIYSNTGEKLKPQKVRKKGQFKCDVCCKVFAQRYYLKNHLITHSSERKHKCEFCGFAFKDPSNLKSHVRRCHIGQKNIACDACSKKFYTKTEFEAHVRTQHTGEKPYVCSFCGLAFQTSSRMTAHSKRHTEKAPYQCSFCKKEVWGKGDLRDHMLVHTKEKPFACPICSARFPRRKSMLRHTKLHEK